MHRNLAYRFLILQSCFVAQSNCAVSQIANADVLMFAHRNPPRVEANPQYLQ
jgi:hypothetical protein